MHNRLIDVTQRILQTNHRKMRMRRLICLIISTSTSSAYGFLSPPGTNSATPHRHNQNGSGLHVATLDGSELFDSSSNHQSTVEQRREHPSRKFLTATIASYLTFLLRKMTSETISVDCTVDVFNSSCHRLSLPNSMAIGTAFVSLLAALRIMLNSSLMSFSAATNWYLQQLECAPLITKCITGGLISFLGDYGAQWFEYTQQFNGNKKQGAKKLETVDMADKLHLAKRLLIQGTYNFRRGMARFVECLLISSPLMHYGYDLFERIVPTSTAAASGSYSCLAAFSHVVADSVFLDGIFVMTGIIATGLLEGHSLKKVLSNLRNVYMPTLKASVMTSSALMPLQFLSFRFLPVQLRVLSVNAVDLIWTGVVSCVSHGDSHLKDAGRDCTGVR